MQYLLHGNDHITSPKTGNKYSVPLFKFLRVQRVPHRLTKIRHMNKKPSVENKNVNSSGFIRIFWNAQ